MGEICFERSREIVLFNSKKTKQKKEMFVIEILVRVRRHGC